MAELTRFHRTWLLPPEVYMDGKDDKKTVKPEFFDLYMKFMRNRVWLEVDCSDVTVDEEERLASLFESQVVNALENKCTGFWTLDFRENEKEEKVSFYIMFENEDDLKTFLGTEAMMFKLAF